MNKLHQMSMYILVEHHSTDVKELGERKEEGQTSERQG